MSYENIDWRVGVNDHVVFMVEQDTHQIKLNLIDLEFLISGTTDLLESVKSRLDPPQYRQWYEQELGFSAQKVSDLMAANKLRSFSPGDQTWTDDNASLRGMAIIGRTGDEKLMAAAVEHVAEGKKLTRTAAEELKSSHVDRFKAAVKRDAVQKEKAIAMAKLPVQLRALDSELTEAKRYAKSCAKSAAKKIDELHAAEATAELQALCDHLAELGYRPS